MDASKLPKGQSLEISSDGRPINLPGIYVHKEAGTKFITSEGSDGVLQADALMSPVWNGGWERVADVPSRVQLLEMRKAQEEKDKQELDAATKEVATQAAQTAAEKVLANK